MSHYSDGQLVQLAVSLEAADWTPADVTLLGQAGRDRLVGIRDSLRRGRGGDIVAAITEGRTELWLASHPGHRLGTWSCDSRAPDRHRPPGRLRQPR